MEGVELVVDGEGEFQPMGVEVKPLDILCGIGMTVAGIIGA